MHVQRALHVKRQERLLVIRSRRPISRPVAICRHSCGMSRSRTAGKCRAVHSVTLHLRLFLCFDKTHVWARLHLPCLAFHIFRRTDKFQFHPRRFQSVRSGFHHRPSGIIGAESDCGFPVHDTDIAVGRKIYGTACGKLSRTGHHGQPHIGTVAQLAPVLVQHSDHQLHVVRPVCTYARRLGSVQAKPCRNALHRPFRRSLVSIFIAIPIPRTFGQTEIIHDAHLGHISTELTAMVEPAPDNLPATPLAAFPSLITRQITPTGNVSARPIGSRTAIFRHHTGNAGILEIRNACAVAVIPGNISDKVYPVFTDGTLRPAHSRRPGRV